MKGPPWLVGGPFDDFSASKGSGENSERTSEGSKGDG